MCREQIGNVIIAPNLPSTTLKECQFSSMELHPVATALSYTSLLKWCRLDLDTAFVFRASAKTAVEVSDALGRPEVGTSREEHV